MLAYVRRHHVGFVALFVALGAAFYTATQLPGGGASTKVSPKAAAAWRSPTIESAIRAAGQTIRAKRVTTVAADAPWVDVGLSVVSGEHLWVDTRSDGKWSGNPRFFPYSDANGLPVYPGAYRIDADAQVDSLIGFVGARPTNIPEVSVRGSTKPGGPGGISRPGFVAVGNTLTNFTPSTTGKVWLRNNDNTNYYSDVGRQVVKVILASN